MPKNNADSGIKSKNILDVISKIKNITVTRKVFDTLTDVVSPQGVLAVINKNKKVINSDSNIISKNNEIDTTADYILALDGIQEPGKFRNNYKNGWFCKFKTNNSI